MDNPVWFQTLAASSKKIALLEGAKALLDWDLETYMPAKGADVRAEQLELLESLIHQEITSASFATSLKEGAKAPNLSLEQKSSLRLWKRSHDKAVKLPASFVEEYSKACSASLQAWLKAKKQNDFSLLEPYLAKVIDLSRKKCSFLTFKEHPYDALIDLYEEGMDTKTLKKLFSDLKPALLSLLKKVPTKNNLSLPLFPKEQQKKLNSLLLESFMFTKGTTRLDLSIHPFCSGVHPDDTRMTTRIDESNPLSTVFSLLHEGGHALYNHNLPKELFGLPICSHASLGFDESQSRLFETMIGGSLPFWDYLYPHLQKLFPEQLKNISLQDFYKNHIQRVTPSLIRTEADEVTYSLHVILRFEIELLLMEGQIAVKDIPSIWNSKMEELLGILPAHDGEGCLQDIHWAIGAFGYFPTYALGNMLAADLFFLLQTEVPSWQKELKEGTFSSISLWLKEKIHKHGALYTPNELYKNILRKDLSPDSYLKYLEKKFAP